MSDVCRQPLARAPTIANLSTELTASNSSQSLETHTQDRTNRSVEMYERMFYSRSVTRTVDEQIGALKRLTLPRISATHWDVVGAKIALRELRRLRGELASAEAVLVGVMKTLFPLR